MANLTLPSVEMIKMACPPPLLQVSCGIGRPWGNDARRNPFLWQGFAKLIWHLCCGHMMRTNLSEARLPKSLKNLKSSKKSQHFILQLIDIKREVLKFKLMKDLFRRKTNTEVSWSTIRIIWVLSFVIWNKDDNAATTVLEVHTPLLEA